MKFARRSFVTTIFALAAALAVAMPSSAQTAGKDYTPISPAQPTEDASKIEVIEFFWLGCPHCFALEPVLKDWVRKLPPDVAFRKVHVPFNEVKHQQLFYALETMGKADDATNAKDVVDEHVRARQHRGEGLGLVVLAVVVFRGVGAVGRCL